MATVAYVAPELVTDGHADPRTDVYSAGIVLFEMLTGRVPYDGDKPVEVAWRHVDQDVPPPSRYVPGLPAALDELVARATRRDPGGRPTDAGAMLAEVQAAREDVGTSAAGARAAAQPTVTVPVSTFDPPTQTLYLGGDRPSWSRLPGEQPTRAQSRRRAAPSRPAREGGLLGWYRKVVGTARGRQAVAAALVVIGLLVAIGGWWFGLGRYTQAPALVGLTQTQAVASARQHGFTVKTGPGRFDDKIAKNTVVGQQPGGNQRIVKGGTITLTLSMGPERYTIPDESGRAYDEAASALVQLKLVPKRVDTYDDVMPAGNVLSTDPPANTVVPPHTEVTVKVSKGKAPISVPNVVGQDANTAQAQLTGLGLKVAFTQQQSDKPANQVTGQSISDGSGAQPGDTIILTVSSGPPLVTVPDLSNKGYSLDQANQLLAQVGLTGAAVFNFPGGQVRQQNPAAGAQAQKGSQVQLWVYP
jgi:serine/threonine-protein kinase